MSEKLNEAITFAAEAHQGQMRKLSGIPYIVHPMEVAAIIGSMTTDEEVIIAGLLHDTVEDCNVDPRVIKERFGARVAALVQSETEDKLLDRPASETWMQRKEESLLMLENTKDIGVKIMWLSDKLSNMRSFYQEYMRSGESMWEKFHQKNPKMQCWYYECVASHVQELSDHYAYVEYMELIDKVFHDKEQEKA